MVNTNWMLQRPGETATSTSKISGWVIAIAQIVAIWAGTAWAHDPTVDKILATLAWLGGGGLVAGVRDALGKK